MDDQRPETVRPTASQQDLAHVPVPLFIWGVTAIGIGFWLFTMWAAFHR